MSARMNGWQARQDLARAPTTHDKDAPVFTSNIAVLSSFKPEDLAGREEAKQPAVSGLAPVYRRPESQQASC